MNVKLVKPGGCLRARAQTRRPTLDKSFLLSPLGAHPGDRTILGPKALNRSGIYHFELPMVPLFQNGN